MYNIIRNAFKSTFNKVNTLKYVFRPVTLVPASETLMLEKVRVFPKIIPRKFVIGVTLLGWLGFEKDDEKKESDLIMTLKRAVLCTMREQYDQAEQQLHLALRLAQQQQNHQGIIYCYDLMANLAFDTFQMDKAEKLFVGVLQMLLGDGVEHNDLRVIHISLKLARIAQLKAEMEKAYLGYQWCLEQIDASKDNSVDSQMLYGIIHDWYAQFLLDNGDVSNSFIHLKKAYEICRKTTESEQCMLLLNDLGITCFRAGDPDKANMYLKEAVDMGARVEDKRHVGVVYANLGLILLERGITEEAQKHCDKASKLGKKYENTESIEQANYCFDQIKSALGK